LLAAALVVLLVKRRFYCCLSLLAPLAVLLVNESYFSPLFSPPILILIPVRRMALADLLHSVARRVQTASMRWYYSLGWYTGCLRRDCCL